MHTDISAADDRDPRRMLCGSARRVYKQQWHARENVLAVVKRPTELAIDPYDVTELPNDVELGEIEFVKYRLEFLAWCANADCYAPCAESSGRLHRIR